MKQFQPMSDSEAEVMRMIWDADGPLTSARMIEQLSRSHDWKPSTVWTFLGRLVEKGLVQAEKQGKRSLYTPAVTEEEYQGARTKEFLQLVHGGSVKSFFAALGGGSRLDAAELRELREWLETKAEEEG